LNTGFHWFPPPVSSILYFPPFCVSPFLFGHLNYTCPNNIFLHFPGCKVGFFLGGHGVTLASSMETMVRIFPPRCLCPLSPLLYFHHPFRFPCIAWLVVLILTRTNKPPLASLALLWVLRYYPLYFLFFSNHFIDPGPLFFSLVFRGPCC